MKISDLKGSDFSLIEDKKAATHPAWASFFVVMMGKTYGRGPLNSAWHWYRDGWDRPAGFGREPGGVTTSEKSGEIRRHGQVAAGVEEGAPIPMLISCPACSARHIDKGAFATKPHHTHACQNCGMTWRPCVLATVGVQFLPGFKDADDSDS
jgi:hypothetical protein